MLTTKLNDFQMTKPDDHFNVATNLFSLRHFNHIKEQILKDPLFIQNKTIPQRYRPKILESLHKTDHIGQVRMATILSNAKITWPNRNTEINQLVRQCETCGVYQPNFVKKYRVKNFTKRYYIEILDDIFTTCSA